MKRRLLVMVLVIGILLFSHIGLAIDTDLLYLSASSICEPDGDTAIAMAISITNDGPETLHNLTVTLLSNKSLSISPSLYYVIGTLGENQTIASTPPWTLSCSGSQAGQHTLYISYGYVMNGTSYTETSIGDVSENLKVNGIFPVIEDMAPAGSVATSSIILSVNTTDDAHCRFHTYDVPYDLMLFDLIGEGRTHTYSQTLGDGSYTYYVRCEDTGGNQNPSSGVMGFTVDTIPPVITNIKPSGTLTSTDFILNVTTDEDTDCRYSFTEPVFGRMEHSFGFISKGHTSSVSLLEGDYTIYAACVDLAGNMVTANAHLNVVTPPIATVSMVPSSPLRPGLIEIELTTNKQVQGIPSLSYSFDDAPSTTYRVSLEGHGSTFSGYTILPETERRRIGSFSFSGQSLDGIVGSQIEDGKLFILDGEIPGAVEGFKGQLLNDSTIRLQWYHFDEDIDHYAIYRSFERYVTYADLYTITDEVTYLDRGIIDGQGYFYRVAPVDEAENHGPLSPEVSVTTPAYDEEASKVYVPKEDKTITLPTSGIGRIDSLIKQVDETRLDVEAAQATLTSASAAMQRYADTLGLFDKVELALEDLGNLRSDLEGFKFAENAPASLDAELTKQELELKKIGLSTPKDIVLLKRSELEEILTKSVLASAKVLATKQFGLTTDQIEAFDELVLKESESHNVLKTVTQLRIDRLGGDSYYILFIEKEIQGDLEEDLMLVELFPEDFLDKADQVTINGEDHKLAKDAPYLTLGIFASSFSYHTTSSGFEEAKHTLTLLLPADIIEQAKVGLVPKTGRGDEGDGSGSLEQVTGEAVFRIPSSPLSISLFLMGFLLIVGLAVYYWYLRNGEGRKKGGKEEDLKRELDELQELSEANLSHGKVVVMGDALVLQSKQDVGPIDPRHEEKEFKDKDSFEVRQKMDKLIEQTFREVHEHRPDKAKALYVKIQVLYGKMHPETKLDYKERILQLHSSFNISSVKRLFNKGYHFIDQGDDRSASMVYGQIKEIYSKMPKDFQKKMFHPSMRLYHKLSWKRIFEKPS